MDQRRPWLDAPHGREQEPPALRHHQMHRETGMSGEQARTEARVRTEDGGTLTQPLRHGQHQRRAPETLGAPRLAATMAAFTT